MERKIRVELFTSIVQIVEEVKSRDWRLIIDCLEI